MNEIVHGIQYGKADERTDAFLPARESAPTLLCSTCSEKLLKSIYSSLNKFIPPFH